MEKHIFPTYINSTVENSGATLESLIASSGYKYPIITQDRLSFCGVASLVNVLQSFGLDTLSQKEILIDESSPSDYWDVLFSGLTLDELEDLFNSQGSFEMTIVRPKTMGEMKKVLIELNNPNTRIVVNFSRVPLFGENIGHHTPVGGYDAETGNVLLLDVTEGYGNYLVELETLYVAIQTSDSETGLQRGFLIIKKS